MKLASMRMLDDVVNPAFRERKGLADIMTDDFVGGTHFDHSLHIEEFDLTCRDCLPCHADAGGGAPQMADCNVCHESQVAMNEGKGIAGIEEIPSLMYGEAADMTCTDCHTGITKGVYRPSSTSCTDCHEGQEYKDIFDEWANTTKARIERLKTERIKVEAALLDADAAKRNTTEAWNIYTQAIRNLKFVRSDGSNGVHNNDYAIAILDSVEADFKKTMAQLDSVW